MKHRTGWVQLTDTQGYLASDECNYQVAKQFFDTDLRVYIDFTVGDEGFSGDTLIINSDEWKYFSELS